MLNVYLHKKNLEKTHKYISKDQCNRIGSSKNSIKNLFINVYLVDKKSSTLSFKDKSRVQVEYISVNDRYPMLNGPKYY